ncbi:MAG: hypothetical protein GY711_14075 [bacterium]|nr:hypothetical protein [bacterium]
MRQVKEGTAELDERGSAILGFADKLARTPTAVGPGDVEALKRAGLSDRDVTDLVHNVGFFAYINRIGAGLGVELEPFMLAGGENVAPGETFG